MWAADRSTLVATLTSPGRSDETVRVVLARDLEKRITAAGLLVARVASARGFTALRAADAPRRARGRPEYRPLRRAGSGLRDGAGARARVAPRVCWATPD